MINGSEVNLSGLIFDRGLNNRNELAFQYQLEDGTEGVAIAQLEPPPTAAVPEPASFAVWCLAVLGIVFWVRWRSYGRASSNGAAPVA